MIQHPRLLLLFSVVMLMVAGAPAAAVLEEDSSASPPSCAHEIVYEPFAGLILVSVTIAGSPPLDFVLDKQRVFAEFCFRKLRGVFIIDG